MPFILTLGMDLFFQLILTLTLAKSDILDRWYLGHIRYFGFGRGGGEKKKHFPKIAMSDAYVKVKKAVKKNHV